MALTSPNWTPDQAANPNENLPSQENSSDVRHVNENAAGRVARMIPHSTEEQTLTPLNDGSDRASQPTVDLALHPAMGETRIGSEDGTSEAEDLDPNDLEMCSLETDQEEVQKYDDDECDEEDNEDDEDEAQHLAEGSVATASEEASQATLSPRSLQMLEDHWPGSTKARDGKYRIPSSAWMPLRLLPCDRICPIVALPAVIESRATLEFLEFTPETADLIWEQYNSDPSYRCKDGILQAACDRIHQLEHHNDDALRLNDAWVGVLQRVGMNESFINRIMRWTWTDWRLTGSARDWAYQCVFHRYMFLQHVDRLVQPEAALVEVPPKKVSGSKKFFVGDTVGNLQNTFGSDGTCSLAKSIQTVKPGNFNCERNGIYLHRDYDVAMENARWLAQIVDYRVCPIGILTIAIPKRMLYDYERVLGSTWQDFVWANQRMDGGGDRYQRVHDARWIVGPISRQTGSVMESLRSKNDIRMRRLPNGHLATQYFTSNEEIIEKLSARGRRTMWLTQLSRECLCMGADRYYHGNEGERDTQVTIDYRVHYTVLS